jgi:hypothetical protein
MIARFLQAANVLPINRAWWRRSPPWLLSSTLGQHVGEATADTDTATTRAFSKLRSMHYERSQCTRDKI